MIEEISKIEEQALADISKAGNLNELESVRVSHLGRKSQISLFLRSLKDKRQEEKQKFGAVANTIKSKIEQALEKRRVELEEGELNEIIQKERIDVTAPGKKVARGHLHPLTLVRADVERIFHSMGFYTIGGPEAETEWYNFDALNIPREHPARDMHDTLWISKTGDPKSSLLLRTHTSPMQVRYMEKHEPPIRIIVPGKVYRREATDATHEVQFTQVEGLLVDKNVSLAQLKGTLEFFFTKFFKKKMTVRFTSSYFPFTEPSVEVHLPWRGSWIEVAGAGMVHQNVFKAAGYAPNEWQGFAFGMSIERLAMLKYGIDDIRLFLGSDLRFLKQF